MMGSCFGLQGIEKANFRKVTYSRYCIKTVAICQDPTRMSPSKTIVCISTRGTRAATHTPQAVTTQALRFKLYQSQARCIHTLHSNISIERTVILAIGGAN